METLKYFWHGLTWRLPWKIRALIGKEKPEHKLYRAIFGDPEWL